MGTSLISVSGRAFPFLTKTFGAGFSVRTRMPAGIHCRQGTVLYEKECERSPLHPVSWQDICRSKLCAVSLPVELVASQNSFSYRNHRRNPRIHHDHSTEIPEGKRIS